MAIVNTSTLQGPVEQKIPCFVSGGRFADKGLWTDTDDSVNDTGVQIAGNQLVSYEIKNQRAEFGGGLTRTRSQYGK